ncbi:YggU family protein [Alginatibacterium sediminis]|uniref:UPF0235 protein DBZ36_14890 n=1 Tax=Alginatibacterium sediminis TaxID=2164068 RepID=A0A420E9D6_9ALTE|nr:YggU family protein [Alginatibacterium sediminis]
MEHDGSLALRVYLQPKASRDQILGLHDGALKIAITAPPVDGKANAHLIKYLSKQLSIAKSKISISSGELNRHKRLHISPGYTLPQQWLALEINTKE